MNEKSAARRERSLRFRRLRRNEKAVSPVVATLILILIAVAAAAGLYLWLTGWQGGVTKSIGTPSIPSNDKFSIGGSTTVFPLTQIAIPWFEANYTANVTNQQGGSVAGAEAYCAGQVDVGAASTSFTTAQLTGDGCSSTLAANTVQNVVAIDAIVGIASINNPIFGTGTGHITASQFSLNATTMLAVYVAASTTVPTQNSPGGLNTLTNLTTLAPYLCGQPAAAFVGGVFQANQTYAKVCPVPGAATSLPWGDIPFPAGCEKTTGGLIDLTGCSFGSANTNRIVAYDRGDSSGTEQGFTQKYILPDKSFGSTSHAFLTKDASGNSCGTDNQLESCNIHVNHAVGNPALAAAVAGDANGIGFNSYGQAVAQASPKLNLAGFQNTLGGPVVQPSVQTVLLYGYKAENPAASYGPWRVLEYLTDGTPAAGTVVANYINFVEGPEVNLALATATGYISLYAA